MTRIPIVGRTGKFTWRMLTAILAGQSVLLLFGALVARGLARAGGAQGDHLLLIGAGLAMLAILAAGLMRGPLGLPLGWLVQVLTWVSAVQVRMMLAVAAIFTTLWVWSLIKGGQVDRLDAQRAADEQLGTEEQSDTAAR